MRVPLSWLKEFVEVPKKIELLCDKLTMAGHMLDKIEKIGQETVIDLELRGNRADCYSIAGIGREVSALFEKKYNPPELSLKLKVAPQLKECKIKIKSPYVKRVMAVAIKNVKIEPSPSWLKERLLSYGIVSINNIVDLTNYVMVETGEPMHAFDLDLIKPEVIIRMAEEGEKMTTFEGIEISTTNDDLVWTKQKTLLSVAGAIGSKDYSILTTTQNVLLEAACYDQANIRRTLRRHNLMTEAGLRHEKDLDPNLVETAIYRYLKIIKHEGWGKVEPIVFDYYPNPRKEKTVSLNYENLEKLGGIKIDPQKIKKIFLLLFFKIQKTSRREITLSVPTSRTDITQEADLIEEVLRIYGYEKIPPEIIDLEIPKVSTPPEIIQELNLKKILVGLGFDEVISSSFVADKDRSVNLPIEKDLKNDPVLISNPISPDFKEMRRSLLSNLLFFVHKVANERGKTAQFFEIGKIYFKQQKNYFEKRRFGIIFWKKETNDFFEFKGFLEALLKILRLPKFSFLIDENTIFTKNSFSLASNGNIVGHGGSAEKNVFYCEIDLDSILNTPLPPTVELWPKYPPIIEDLSLVFPPRTLIGPVIEQIKSTDRLIEKVELIGSYQDTKTFRITFQSEMENLNGKIVSKVREKIIKTAEKSFNASLKTDQNTG